MSKKKKIIASLCAVIVVLLAVVLYIIFGVVGVESKRTYPVSEAVNNNANSGITVIDNKTTYQTMNGFGASACWWGQEVGTWENSEEILSYLYDSKDGIGLNIYRYNLGAGSEGDEHILEKSRRTECFLKADGSYNFGADAGAQKALATAKKLSGDDLRVTLFCNSAPVSLTKNGKGYCDPVKDENEQYVSNLDKENYGAFAEYCYECADYFLSQGYRVTDVSPINEPQYSWRAWYNEDGTYSVNQEGCYYRKQEAADLLGLMVKKFDESEVDKKGCKISMFESGAAEGKGSTAAAYIDCILGKGPKYVLNNIALRDYFDTVSTHSYWSSTDTKKEAASYLQDKYSNYDVVCTEYCQMTDDENTGVHDLIAKEENGTNGLGIEYGVAMAKVIVDDLTILNAKEWDWWLGCSYGTYTDGLVYINADDHSDIKTSKRLWCLGNFSKFIEEGAVRVACSSGVEGLDSVAFCNEDGSTVIVYVNATNNDLSTDASRISAQEVSVYTTDEARDLELTASSSTGTMNGTVSVPAQSVVTVVAK